MGVGASNRVRSRSDCSKAVVCSSNSIDTKQQRNENIFAASTNAFVNNGSETLVGIKSQKISPLPNTRCLPSPTLHTKSNSSEKIENSVKNFDLQNKIKELESALALSESNNLDLMDQVQTLEERCNVPIESHSPAPNSIIEALQEMLKSKDQQIVKLEADLKSMQTEYQEKVLKSKKRIRRLTKQNFELRQEISIIQMEIKTQQNDQLETQVVTPVSSKDSGISHVEHSTDNNHTKVIVELSNQISEQTDEVARLKAEVAEKTQQIINLETTQLGARKPAAMIVHAVHSSRHSENQKSYESLVTLNDQMSNGKEKCKSPNYETLPTSALFNSRYITSTNLKTNILHTSTDHNDISQQYSTALSDSDSDWTESRSAANVYRHSAPSQTRTKHSISKPVTRNIKAQSSHSKNDA